MRFKMANNLARAIALAASEHLEQLDKGGKPYILHPLRMMMRLRTTDEELMAIAVLHDVVEDCGVSYADLQLEGMSDRVIAGVKALTKQRGETYEEFITRCLTNHDAMLVKREDLRDNSDITRLQGITEKDVQRMEKYAIAFKRIDNQLNKQV
jgi:(p)ppGpp synthase/HD superfamily hydrolase